MTKSTKCPHCSAPIHLPAGDEWAPIKCNFCGLAVKISDFAGAAKPSEPVLERVEKIAPVERTDRTETQSAVEPVRSELATSESVSMPAVSNEPVAEPESATGAARAEPEQATTEAAPDVVAAASAPQEAIPDPVPPVIDRPTPAVEPQEKRRGRASVAVPVSTTAPVVAKGDAPGADFTPDAYDAADADAPSVWNTVVMVACIALVILSVVLAVVLVYNS